MGRIYHNNHGTSGKIGAIIYRLQKDGKILVASRPKKRKKKISGSQQKVRDRFNAAAFYAKKVKETPELLQYYQSLEKPGKSVHLLAMTDCMRPPRIEETDVSSYDGAAGSEIRVHVIKDGQLTVKVRIEKADGTLVEEGLAVQQSYAVWVYEATASNDALSGSRITVSAKDLPGNVVRKEIIL